jgi:molybdopterin converting factor small subunit
MNVEVKLYGEMKCYAPGEQSEFSVTLAEGATVGDVLTLLNIPPDSQHVVLLNGKRTTEAIPLKNQSTLVLFPQITGG